MDKIELKKLACEKLKDARKLIDEAEKLAIEGQFALDFGDVGSFMPSSYKDKETWMEKAREEVKTKGIYVSYKSDSNGVYRTIYKPISECSNDEIEEEIVRIAENMASDYDEEDRDYDCFWTPSTC